MTVVVQYINLGQAGRQFVNLKFRYYLVKVVASFTQPDAKG